MKYSRLTFMNNRTLLIMDVVSLCFYEVYSTVISQQCVIKALQLCEVFNDEVFNASHADPFLGKSAASCSKAIWYDFGHRIGSNLKNVLLKTNPQKRSQNLILGLIWFELFECLVRFGCVWSQTNWIILILAEGGFQEKNIYKTVQKLHM